MGGSKKNFLLAPLAESVPPTFKTVAPPLIMRVVYTPLPSRDPKLIPVLGSQPAYDVSHKSGGRLSLISTRPAVTRAIFQTAGANFVAW